MNYETLGAFYDPAESKKELEFMSVEIYSYRDNAKDDSEGLPNQAYYVKRKFDYRIWRVGGINKLNKLLKALKKEVRIRYSRLEWID